MFLAWLTLTLMKIKTTLRHLHFLKSIVHISNTIQYYTPTRSIQRTQTPPRLWPLTLSCDLDLKSRSNRLMSLDVAYCIVPCTRYDMSVSVIVCDIWPYVHFLWPLTFACDLHRPSRSLSFLSLDGHYIAVCWFKVRSL